VVGGEPAYYCIPRFANLCLPCQADSDCRTAQGTDDDRCVALGDEGSFCGAFCSDALPCPDGTACQDVLTADGGTSAQCVPPRTACENTNAFGTCAGVLSCQEGGPACVGPVPAMEECNLVDDNCNGQTDEGFANTDGDALADCVDPDLDNDGILNPLDNCPLVYNPAQEDSDGDGVGDACP
jgi:hypothetical protein